MLKSLSFALLVLLAHNAAVEAQATNGTAPAAGGNSTAPLSLPTFQMMKPPADAPRAKNCLPDNSLCVTMTDLGDMVDFMVEGPQNCTYIGLGVGTGMTDADLYVGYVRNGKFIISSRRAPQHAPPLVQVNQTAVPVRGGKAVEPGKWVSQFQRLKKTGDPQGKTVDTSGPVNLVWSYNTQTPVDFTAAGTGPDSDFKGKIVKHLQKGKISVNLKDAAQVSLAASASTGSTGNATSSSPATTTDGASATAPATAKSVSEELAQRFNECRTGNVRYIKAVIESESVRVGSERAVQPDASFEQEFNSAQTELNETDPCYILMRLDELNENGEYKWLFGCYVPDHAHVRQKMLYASTQSTVKMTLGAARFTDSLYATEKVTKLPSLITTRPLQLTLTLQSELTHAAYLAHLASESASAMSPAEREYQAQQKQESGWHISTSTTHAVTGNTGISLPLSDALVAALDKLKHGPDGALLIGISDETIVPLFAGDRAQARQQLPEAHPSYTIAKLSQAYAFIFCCTEQSKVKDRMVYSSCKPFILSQCEQLLGTPFARRAEISDVADFPSDSELSADLASGSKSADGSSNNSGLLPGLSTGKKAAFEKPARPGRGTRSPVTRTGTTWKGCGKHIDSVMANVPKEKQCTCPRKDVEGNSSLFLLLAVLACVYYGWVSLSAMAAK
ncbi:Twinfilin-1 [Sorochytrium milnesiophthora]